MSRPSQSIPFGFLIVFFGLLAFVYSCVAGYVAWLVWSKPVAERLADHPSLVPLLARSGLGFMIALGLIWYGLHLALRTAPYDTRDPDEPSIKF